MIGTRMRILDRLAGGLCIVVRAFEAVDLGGLRPCLVLIVAHALLEAFDALAEVAHDVGYAAAPEEYEQDKGWLRTADENLRGFMELARAWDAREPKLADGEIPKPAVDMRITPKV